MRAKAIFLLSLLVIMGSALSAQIKATDVPQDVVVSFKYKYADGVIQEWRKDAEDYIAAFTLNNQEAAARFDADGKWLETRFTVKDKELPGQIINYYKENFKKQEYVIASSDLVKNNKGENFYQVFVKKEGINQPDPIELYFDLSGNFQKKVDPEEVKIEKDFDDPGKTDVKTGDKDNNEMPLNSDVSVKELPTPVNSYIKANYKEFTIKESKYINELGLGNVYHLVLKQQGLKGQIDLYFDLSGALLKTLNSADKKEDQQKKDSKNGQVNPTQNQSQQQTQNETQPKDDWEKYIVADTKVPATAKQHFLTKNKKATNVSWYFKEKKYIVKYVISTKKGMNTYSEEGVWLETRIEQDEVSLSPLITNYLKDNYRSLQISLIYYYQVPKDKYYDIYMYDKHSKEKPAPMTIVTFDGTGKFRNIDKPELADPNSAAEQKRREKEEQEFQDKVDAGGAKIDAGKTVNDEVDPKELPTPIIKYMKDNYKEHIIKKSRYMADAELGQVYYLEIKKEGLKDIIKLYFDVTGNLLKKIDPADDKYIKENEIPDEPVTPQGNTDEKINLKELPAGVSKYVKSKYPEYKIEQAFMKTSEEYGNHYKIDLKKQGVKKTTILLFDLNGNFIKVDSDNDAEE
ncbi:MAG: PepSY-like domain-containing protein [Bacteroidota bacterium]